MGVFLGKYRGVRIESHSVKGEWLQIADRLEWSLKCFSRSDRWIGGWYIGIASGYDPFDGLKARIDDNKHYIGIDRMVCVYESPFTKDTKQLETELLRRFNWRTRHPLCRNKGPGGEGRNPRADKTNYLYFAFETHQPDIMF